MRKDILQRIAMVLLGLNLLVYSAGADWGILEPQQNSTQDKDSACPGEGTGPDENSFTVKVEQGAQVLGAASNVVGGIGWWGQHVTATTPPFPISGSCSFNLYHQGDVKDTHSVTFQ